MVKYIYSINVNVSFCLKHKIDFEHFCLIHMISKAYQWADTQEHEGGIYYRLNMVKIHDELPMISSKNDTVYRYMKILVDKGLIEKIPKKDYYRLTDEGKNYDYMQKGEYGYTEKNPTPDGKKSDSEKNPTYTITDIWNKNINDYITNEGLTFLSEAVKEKFVAYLVNRIVLGEKTISVDTVKTAHSSLHKHGKTEEDQLEIIFNSVQSSWKGLFPLKKKNNTQQKSVGMYEDKKYESKGDLSAIEDL